MRSAEATASPELMAEAVRVLRALINSGLPESLWAPLAAFYDHNVAVSGHSRHSTPLVILVQEIPPRARITRDLDLAAAAWQAGISPDELIALAASGHDLTTITLLAALNPQPQAA